MKNKPIWICLATRDNFPTVTQTISSISELADLYPNQEVRLMVLDKSERQHLKNWLGHYWKRELVYEDLASLVARDMQNAGLYHRLNHPLGVDSIQRARLQMLLASRQYEHKLSGTIVWQIDDDMVFGEAKMRDGEVTPHIGRNFFGEVQAYHDRYPGVDAAIGYYSNVPPLPILLYLEKQLVDLLRNGDVFVEGFSNPNYYHDLYGVVQEEIPIGNPINLDGTMVDKMLKGVLLTRPMLSANTEPEEKAGEPSILRGGNFIVFKPEILTAVPHLALHFEGVTSRRSDLIHALMLQKMGFKLASISLSLFHNREFPVVDCEKMCLEYLRDALGAVALRYMSDSAEAWDRYEAHRKHMQRLTRLLDRPDFSRFPVFADLREHLGLILGRWTEWKEKGLARQLLEFEELFMEELKKGREVLLKALGERR